jgi:hypothetical protein
MNYDYARSILVIEPGFEGPLSGKPYQKPLERFVENLDPPIMKTLHMWRAKIRGVSPYTTEVFDDRDIKVRANPSMIHDVLTGIGLFLDDKIPYQRSAESKDPAFRRNLLKDDPQLAELNPARMDQLARIAFGNIYASVNGGNPDAMIFGRSVREFPNTSRWVVDNTTPALNPASRVARTVGDITYPAQLKSFADIVLPGKAAIPGVPALSPRIALGNRPTATSPGQRL